MRRIGLSILSVFLLFFFASSIQAQNQSAENSEVILFNGCYEWSGWTLCPDVGIITWSGEVQEIAKSLANGTTTFHYNAFAEGTDELGREYRWHDTWNEKIPADYPDNFHMTRTVIIQGAKGVKFKLKSMWVVRDGEIINSRFEADC
jgi:hypothetical protein